MMSRRLARPLVRWLGRRLWRTADSARAVEDRLRLEGIIRFVGLYAVMVIGPSVILGYLGLVDSFRGEASMTAEVQDEADATLDAYVRNVDDLFSRLETATRSRMYSGRSLLESPRELSPYVLVALRLDSSGSIAAPFDEPEEDAPADRSFYFSGEWKAAREAEQRGEPRVAAHLYREAVREVRGMGLKGSAELHRARALAAADQARDAETLYADIVADYSQFRDIWGFPIGDVARLERGELLLLREPEIGVGALQGVVEDIMGRRWVLGQGGEAAIVRRALQLMEGYGDSDWIAIMRSRVDERNSQLYWAGRLLDELEPLTAGGRLLKGEPGQFRYTLGRQALWATVWHQEQLYAFALDRAKVLETIHDLARSASRADSVVALSVLDPESTLPAAVLARRSLAPWTPGWSAVAHPVDPEGLANTLANRRLRRIALVLFSIVLVGLGALLTGRLVGREMELARMKTGFAANVSHELRSPITQIRLKGESLQLGLAEDESDVQQHYDTIVREAERLSRLVDNVLDFAAIERGTKNYNIRAADLSTTLRGAVEAMRSAMETRSLELQADIPDDLPMIPHDPDAVAQAVTNLLSNAAKYGAGGGWIGVSTTVLPDGIEVCVADRGIGIDPEEARRIFDRFYRSRDPRARRLKGTGIGLAIVKYIMEAHGGQASVSSSPGNGSTFTLTLPFSTPSSRMGAS